MTAESFALVVAVSFLGFAVVAGRERWLLAAVLGYTAVLSWIIQVNMDLVMPALAMAIALGALGLGVILHREMLTQDDAVRPDRRKVKPTTSVHMQNIGQSPY